ncbi:CRISPR-associated protein Cas4 [Anaerovorax sp. IOR16]|uniref:CRISPR-associated protein Cas4 n=1 Tax=Anaerovorax sp. IOR16 TaxID=2773458 RepID=UPI0019D0A33E|nr:CRISPR-associated protein Cas4 [Anaerovorax sp. IOR16]
MEKTITGIMVYYHQVCPKKLWYFYHELNMEHNSEDVAIGKIIDEASYSREKKHINIDNTINIDFIQRKALLHEVKKSKKIEEAGIWQVKYYLFYLEQKGVFVNAQIDYPLLKQTLSIKLEEDDRIKLEWILKEIKTICMKSIPPLVIKKKFCSKCAFYDLYFI